jgi:hypothetical protein
MARPDTVVYAWKDAKDARGEAGRVKQLEKQLLERLTELQKTAHNALSGVLVLAPRDDRTDERLSVNKIAAM